ncbi:MAG: CdaR family protein [Candidatus Ornithospirochaeta sp.]
MQSKNKFSNAVFGNWVAKVFSFLCALGIVVAVRFLNVTDRVVTIPVTVYVDAQSQYVPVSLVPESVDVVITGDDDIVYLVDPSLITASVDFSDVGSDGIARRVVDLDYDNDIFSSYGLTIKASPATIRILFQEKE